MAESKFLLLDTGPLRELILYSAVENLGFARRRREIQFLQTEGRYQNLSAFISGFRKRTTTPHVVSEMSSWILRTFESGRANIWRLVFDEFTRMQMDEQTIELLRMPCESVIRLGATDSGLLEAASELGAWSTTVLSIDHALVAECRGAGLQALHLRDVVEADVV